MSVFTPPAMALLRPRGRPGGRVHERVSGPDQLAVAGVHGGGHPSELRGHVDAGHPGTPSHGTFL